MLRGRQHLSAAQQLHLLRPERLAPEAFIVRSSALIVPVFLPLAQRRGQDPLQVRHLSEKVRVCLCV